MSDIAKIPIYRDNWIAILAYKDHQKTLVDESELAWNEDDFLHLDEISDQLKYLGYSFPFIVWEEIGIRGTIYQYGNFEPPEWEVHGETNGYA